MSVWIQNDTPCRMSEDGDSGFEVEVFTRREVKGILAKAEVEIKRLESEVMRLECQAKGVAK